MDLEITEEDPRPRAYLYTGSGSDYYFIVWMSSNPTVATVDGDGKVTGRSAGTATITAISDRGDRASCKVTVTKESAGGEAKKPALDQSSLSLALKYDDLHPTKQLKLINNDHSFIYVYQWLSSNPEVATVNENGLVTAQGTGQCHHHGAGFQRTGRAVYSDRHFGHWPCDAEQERPAL